MNTDEKSGPWSQDLKSLLNKTGINPLLGQTSETLNLAYQKFGKNIFNEKKVESKFHLLIKQFQNPMSYTLLLATGISFFLREVADGVAIFSILLINSFIGYFQEYKSNRSIESLKQLSQPFARVIRDGQVHKVAAEEVVPGDILYLEAGDYVVADARIMEANQLYADESVLTGESLPTAKTTETLKPSVELAERKNMLFAATAVSAGSGKALVTQTGMNTEIGRIAELIESKEISLTPLQNRLNKVSYLLLLIGLIIIVFVVVFGRLNGEDWGDILMAAIGLAVAAIPEGLPTIVTLSLALAINRMSQRKVIIRDLSSVETLGSTDIICTDKTGTLTTGRMRVRKEFFLDKEIENANFLKCSILCNKASLWGGESGDPTEVALLYMAQEHGEDIQEIRKKNPIKDEISFDSSRKRMSVVTEDGTVYTKGAPESIIEICLLTQKDKKEIADVVHKFSSEGHRTLALAWRKDTALDEQIEENLNFLGIVSIADPPREETKASIHACKEAGIKIVMITGDHPSTARAIATELGIINDKFDGVLAGNELNKMSKEEIQVKADHTAVYARVTPEDKLKIVEALQSRGHIVAMTGDGVNDAPALKSAAIGVSMGKGGTEVAKQASSMILTDDKFSTIVSAIEEGRAIYGNIRRTIQYLLSTNLAELLIMLGASILRIPTPLNPVALLWINLVTDGFPSLALAAEPVPKNFLTTSHAPSPTTFFDSRFLLELTFVGVLNTILGLGLYYYLVEQGDIVKAKSYIFTFLTYLCLFRSFSCRSEEKTYFELKFNPWHFSSVIVPILVQFFAQNTHLFQSLFKVRILSLAESLSLLGLGLFPVTLIEFLKMWRRK